MRLLLYIVLGLSLLLANYWFIQSIRRWLLSDDFIIAPFEVTQQDVPNGYGRMLARMLTARLANLQRNLRQVREATTVQQLYTSESHTDLQPTVTTLFVSQAVDIPTDLFQPIDIQLSVGGVEFGGIFAWLQRILTKQRTLIFTVMERDGRAVVSSYLRGFARVGVPYLWFESEAGADEITTNIAHALIQRKLSQDSRSQIAALDLKDFRTLLEGVLKVEQLNERVRQRYVVDDEFITLLPDIEQLSQKAPQWHELSFLAGNIAESGGNRRKAIEHYQRVLLAAQSVETDAPPVSATLAGWVRDRLSALGTVTEPQTTSQTNFIRTAREFAQLMGFTDRDPEIEFKQLNHPGVQAMWNTETGRYEINVDDVDTPGLPQYVAVMGRFMDRNYQRCVGEGAIGQGRDFTFWNEFRHSVVGYLIQAVPTFSHVNRIGERYELFQVLKSMEKGGVDTVQRLALELLKRYSCDWSRATIADKVQEINQEGGFLPDEAVHEAFAHHLSLP